MLLSGIGPKDELAKNNIPVFHELAMVGKDLSDHVAVWQWFTFPKIKTTTSLKQVGKDILRYYRKHRTGNFAGIGTTSTIAFEPAEPKGDVIVETYYLFFEKDSLDLLEVLRWHNYKDKIYNAIVKANAQGAVAVVLSSLLIAHSRGVVSLHGLKGADAFINPYLDYGYFSDAKNRDKDNLIGAMQNQIAREKTETYKKGGGKLIPMPVCSEFKYGSYEFCDCYTSQFTGTLFHPTGTCRMGTNPSKSVVNTKGQVHGIEALRIADASV